MGRRLRRRGYVRRGWASPRGSGQGQGSDQGRWTGASSSSAGGMETLVSGVEAGSNENGSVQATAGWRQEWAWKDCAVAHLGRQIGEHRRRQCVNETAVRGQRRRGTKQNGRRWGRPASRSDDGRTSCSPTHTGRRVWRPRDHWLARPQSPAPTETAAAPAHVERITLTLFGRCAGYLMTRP